MNETMHEPPQTKLSELGIEEIKVSIEELLQLVKDLEEKAMGIDGEPWHILKVWTAIDGFNV